MEFGGPSMDLNPTEAEVLLGELHNVSACCLLNEIK